MEDDHRAGVPVARSIAELRRRVGEWRAAGERIGLVPTMGALHAGHLALVAASQARCRRTVVSIFVNPKQFGPREDFSSYPRPEADDLDKLSLQAAFDLVFTPPVAEMYPDASRRISASAARARGCAARSGRGISTVSRRWSPS